MKDIAVFGCGGLGREVIALIEVINGVEKQWNVIGFYDDGESESSINNYPVLGGVNELNELKRPVELVIALGSPKIKEIIHKKITNSNITYPTLIHPSVIFFNKERVKIGRGCILFANTVFTTDIEIGDFVFIHNQVSISHDVVIASYCTLMSVIAISSKTFVGQSSYLGNGVMINCETIIPEFSLIRAGSIFTNQ